MAKVLTETFFDALGYLSKELRGTLIPGISTTDVQECKIETDLGTVLEQLDTGSDSTFVGQRVLTLSTNMETAREDLVHCQCN